MLPILYHTKQFLVNERNYIFPVNITVLFINPSLYHPSKWRNVFEFQIVLSLLRHSGSHNFGPYATNPAAGHGASANVATAFGVVSSFV